MHHQKDAEEVVQLGKLIPDAWASPGWVVPPHGFDECSRIGIQPRASNRGRPPLGRLFHRQNKRKPARCQAITVAGLTMVGNSSQRGQHSIQRHPEEPVRAGEPRTLDLTVQHVELLA